MTLKHIKDHLQKLDTIAFQLPNGSLVHSLFHVTEIGKITKEFIDCCGTLRQESVINFQLWNANDYNHRLHPEKLIKIIELAERELKLDANSEIEVEYQGETIQKFGLDFNGKMFELVIKQTDCLAKDNCGIPVEKPKVKLRDLNTQAGCTPGGNCC
ncbi:DUF6428 family protein [Formosa sp. S-31]|uniref:DUF6428 family protein n=1 Tax=Formosa sp. S-31 TaxID=2790949 RepID=UPI003EB71A15